MKLFYCILVFITCFTISCRKDKVLDPFRNYLHLSHTRTNNNPTIDSYAEQIDFNKFDMLWLGGDLAYLTSEDENTMAHVDSIFNLGSTNTLWALGNHDYTDLERVEQFTNRPPYYSNYNNGITFIVLDTQDSLSNIVGSQKDFVVSILDTIESSSHLILLHHKLIWMYGNTYLESQIPSISNANLGNCFYCINPNNFNSEVYPKLIEVKQRGIEVLCIGGDIGFQTNEFEYITSDGIYFLASGINAGNINNKALQFWHDITNRTLTWEFKLISEI